MCHLFGWKMLDTTQRIISSSGTLIGMFVPRSEKYRSYCYIYPNGYLGDLNAMKRTNHYKYVLEPNNIVLNCLFDY
jgi:hypothetical protein